jgi:Lipocalin-like domain
MRQIPFVLTAISLVAATAISYAQKTTTKDQLLGTWKVVVLKATSGDKVSYPLGERPAGYVSITPDRIWLLFVDSTRKAPVAAALTDAEAISMMKSHVAWTGNYTTAEQTADGLKIAAHVDAASSQAITGNERVYFMRVDGDKLTMKSPGAIVPMTGATSVVEILLTKAE